MDTKPLERFATWARRELLTSVDAQISAVLASGSIARAERGEAVRRLETEIERHGRQHVTDKIAYIWFNRIIALRFMDARGYTDTGVVSPMRGQEHGQPEILADAKRGVLDTEVVTSKHVADSILGLLEGTRSSVDAEGETYALLLTEYCHFWHKSMPFMFEREGDYTELLVPANLLADGSILSRARDALTEEVCGDVEVIGWLYQFYISERKDEVFADFKQNKKAGADEIPAATQLFTPHWIVRYLVENSVGRLWMLNRPKSRLIEQMDYYIKPVDEGTDFLKINGPEEITVIDPASGSGHMLTYAFDLLYAIYEEEGYAPSDIPTLILQNNLYGTEIDPRAGALAAFALTMKARAKQRTFFTKQIAPKIVVIEPIKFRPDEVDALLGGLESTVSDQVFWNQFEHADVLGSLIMPNRAEIETAKTALAQGTERDDIIYTGTFSQAEKFIRQAEILSKNYAAVVANPPYMGSKNMGTELASFAKHHFPDSKSDLFAMFLERAGFMVKSLGYMAQVTMQSWMFLSSYEKLRQKLNKHLSIESLLHMDNMVMRIAFGTSATVWKTTGSTTRLGAFTYLTMSDMGKDEPLHFPAKNERNRLAEQGYIFWRNANDFVKIPGSPIAYWLSEAMRHVFENGQALSLIAEPRKGMDTGDNARFLRAWWELSLKSTSFLKFEKGTWNPYNKGGGFRKWYGNRDILIDWRRGGRNMRTRSGSRYFGRSGWTWGTVTSGGLSLRFTPEGAAFDNGGCTLFSDQDLEVSALVLNSTTAETFLKAISPTLNYQPINIGSVPIIGSEVIKDTANVLLQDLVETSQSDWNDYETSWDFKKLSWLRQDGRDMPLSKYLEVWSTNRLDAARLQQQREIENNLIVAEAYGLKDEVPIDVPLHRVSLSRNVEFTYGPGKTVEEYKALERADLAAEMISYAVGCMFGRYSLDEQGLILANQGETLQDYSAKVPSPSFMPDTDNVIPFVDDGWFQDDIVERFREFLRVTFGTQHFEENLRFMEESLGVKTIRDYFITRNGKSKFYDDHVKRYKKRPLYWMFSSPKGSFNALIYMHRYTPSTVSTVLNEYLREYRAKLEVALGNAEEAAAAGSVKDQKEADRLRKVLVELAEYEHDILYPLATKQLPIDLDDGVLVNYLKFGRALKNIGFEKDRKKVEGWDWPHYPLEPIK